MLIDASHSQTLPTEYHWAHPLKQYQADLSAGSLMLPESRIIAGLLLQRLDDAAWQHALRVENVLQKSAPATAVRQARLIRLRLESIDASVWSVIRDGDKEMATQLLFAAALKHSELLKDFLREVVADHVRRLEHSLSVTAWEPFLHDCAARDPAVATWSNLTRKKLLQVIIRILAEARYLESTRSLRLLPPHLHPVVRRSLLAAGEGQLVQMMEFRV
ncbi:DUF1819 family protein [Xanthomonas campestris pv. campestris]|uniref:DUF1819 family protein n=1 Tax=Xanthomonas campestris TaxID=339 RepID=UPI0025A1BC0E|nr:DUF1819 family protein [Xanthomonas campestris]MDM7714797.1 DUF1819 family protein [Xanthomonas campestris pv. campestris]MEB2027419.1 DUF1819 family protein [Xanthomonas campestris pv. campestris]